MAELIVNHIVRKFTDRKLRPCITKRLPLSGGEAGGSKYFKQYVTRKAQLGVQYGISLEESTKLAQYYGSNVEKVFAYLQVDHPILPKILYAQLQYAIEHELVIHPADFFIRRTSSLFFDIDSVRKYKEAVLHEMQIMLGWNTEQRIMYTHELQAEIVRATTSR